jgi:diphthamide synthase (EF-2-diphthine--ammonia ligase)
MAGTCAEAVAAGIEGIAFGDLVLEDVRTYREKQMRNTGLLPIFPLWGQPTRDLAKQMIASGMRAKLTCVDKKKLDASFAGRGGCYPSVPIALTKLYCSCSPEASGPVIAAAASSGY